MQQARDRRVIHRRYWWESQKERDHYEYLDVGERIIIKWNLQKYYGVLWTGFIWLKIRTSGGVLRTW
jgi:hypothetical protein